MQSRKTDSFFANVDWLTVFIYLALVAIGVVNIYAAVYDEDHPKILAFTQLFWVGWAVAIGVILLIISADFYAAFAYHIYGLLFLILIVTLLMPSAHHGSKSWLNLGFTKIQPAEFAKFATGLAMAKFLSNTEFNLKNYVNTFVTVGLFSIPALLVLLENETGLALVFIAFIIVIYREGLSLWFLVVGATLIALFLCALKVNPWIITTILLVASGGAFLFIRRNKINFLRISIILLTCVLITWATKPVYDNSVDWGLLKPHQKDRIDVLLGFKKDNKGTGYNVNQSMIAIGSGGLFGKGWLQGTQTKYDFVPEQETDFIFCTIGEEWGFVGSAVVLLLQLGLNIRVIYLAERQRSSFSRIYGYCVAAVLFFHLAVNVGMTIGLMPVVGIPLPFISYGGSSLLAFTFLIFIFIKLDSNRLSVLR